MSCADPTSNGRSPTIEAMTLQKVPCAAKDPLTAGEPSSRQRAASTLASSAQARRTTLSIGLTWTTRPSSPSARCRSEQRSRSERQQPWARDRHPRGRAQRRSDGPTGPLVAARVLVDQSGRLCGRTVGLVLREAGSGGRGRGRAGDVPGGLGSTAKAQPGDPLVRHPLVGVSEAFTRVAVRAGLGDGADGCRSAQTRSSPRRSGGGAVTQPAGC